MRAARWQGLATAGSPVGRCVADHAGELVPRYATADSASSARSTSAARNGSSGNTITKCRAAASSSRWSAWRTTGRAMRRWCGRCLRSRRGMVVACGMNPHYGDFDPYHMAASAIDEAVRNCVAVGADPSRIAILDNFCWGDCDRPETLGSLVRAALACHDVAIALGTPFISGKDSLNNEFRHARPRHAADRHSAVAVDQRHRANRRRVPLRDDGSEGAGQLAVHGRRDEGRIGRFAFRLGRDRAPAGNVPQVNPPLPSNVRRTASRDPCRTGPRLPRSERRRLGRGRGRDGVCRRTWSETLT